jgi:pimeloyl-ACP methyl ester carboxylesterase
MTCNSQVQKISEKFAEVRGFGTRYLEAGRSDAPVLLLLHDGAWGGASSVTWSNAIPRLADHFRVLAPDMLGFGGTDKVVQLDASPYKLRISHLDAFLTALKIHEPVYLVGNSFGGSVALRWMAERPASFLGVMAFNGTGGPWRTALSRAELGRWDGTKNDLARVVSHLIDDNEYFQAQLQERYRWATVSGHYRAVSSVGVPLPESLKSQRETDDWPIPLKDNPVPLCLVAGEADPLLDRDWHQHIRAVKHDTTVFTGPFRHAPMIDRPEIASHLIREFLLSSDTGGRPSSTRMGMEAAQRLPGLEVSNPG